MNHFPSGDEEINLVKFIAKFQYLSAADTKYFFESQKYYRARITNLIKKKILRRTKQMLVLDEVGVEFCKLFGFEYTNLNRNKKYLSRLLCISNIGAYYNNTKNVHFTPSFAIKDKEMFTITARKFIGVFEIEGFEYLTYYISQDRDNKYIKSVIYDIQKENKYKNIIVFVNDIRRIDINEFAFGYNQVLIIEDNDNNRELLKSMNNISWNKAIQNIYKNKAYISEHNFCDYMIRQNKYISCFFFLDSEKLNRIKYFLRENKNKKADIICPKELKWYINTKLQNATIYDIDLNDYVEKTRIVYD